MPKYQIVLKPIKWETNCSMRTDGRTDRHNEASIAFRNFANAAEIIHSY
jgi:hypothetical protein